jgi:hypothetical protein
MKKLLAIFAFILLGLTYVQAQETTLDVPAELTETIIQKLELTPEQTATVNKIKSYMQPAMQRIADSNLSDADKTKKINAYADREKLNMKNILTEDQFAQYLELTGRI